MFYYYHFNSLVNSITHAPCQEHDHSHFEDVDLAQEVMLILEDYFSGSHVLRRALQCIESTVGYDAFLDYDDDEIMTFLQDYGFIDLE